MILGLPDEYGTERNKGKEPVGQLEKKPPKNKTLSFIKTKRTVLGTSGY